jgi:hypothetical protein
VSSRIAQGPPLLRLPPCARRPGRMASHEKVRNGHK